LLALAATQFDGRPLPGVLILTGSLAQIGVVKVASPLIFEQYIAARQ
jgi:hypothetical protein